MVNIIENWSNIRGTFISVKKNKKIDNFLQIKLKLVSSEDVEGFPNLAKIDIAKNIIVNVPTEMKEIIFGILEKEESIIVRKAFGEEYFVKNV